MGSSFSKHTQLTVSPSMVFATAACQHRQQENGNQTGPRVREQGERADVMVSRGGQIGGESAGDRGEDGRGVPAGIGDEATAR